jgi:hypothetical protein
VNHTEQDLVRALQEGPCAVLLCEFRGERQTGPDRPHTIALSRSQRMLYSYAASPRERGGGTAVLRIEGATPEGGHATLRIVVAEADNIDGKREPRGWLVRRAT